MQPVAVKPIKKAAAKVADKKGKAIEVAFEQPLDPVAEKFHQQRLVFLNQCNICLFRILIIIRYIGNTP